MKNKIKQCRQILNLEKKINQRPNLTNLKCVQTIPTRDAVQTWLVGSAGNFKKYLEILAGA